MADEVVTPTNTDGKTTDVKVEETKTNASLINAETKTAVTDSKTDVKVVEPPAEYTDFKLPEGIEADKETLDAFKTEAKGLKLTQEQAQKFVDMQAALAQKQGKVANEMWTNVQKDWVDKAKNDKEYGGQAFDANLALAKKAMEKFSTPEFKAAMDLTGMGNHPELIRFLVRVGKHFKEDEVLKAGNQTQATKDPAKILFPNMA